MPVHQLPIRVRPVLGETVLSYVFRLAHANDLDRPTLLLRALGRPNAAVTRFALDRDYEVSLNELALRRLETVTGRSSEQLRAALTNLHRISATPEDNPTIWLYKGHDLLNHCDHCVARIPGKPTIRVHRLLFPQLCQRHRRWLDPATAGIPRQVNLSNTPEIVTAHRRYSQLRAANRDHHWTHIQLRQATWIAMDWARHSKYRARPLHDRWQTRADALGIGHGPYNPTPLLVFPEAVALAEVLSDLNWRRHVAMVHRDSDMDRFFRHVAMVHRDSDMDRFFRHVAQRMNQPATFADWLTSAYLLHNSPNRNHRIRRPLPGWINQLRHKHLELRTEFWQQHFASHATSTPFPEIRHFK
ncbi:hypothetical protein F8271_22360 [Micromonospora sp. ALFpr18c]|nr:hypothetical protein F8271_22360 [Micromonospora sp. ALFpr18c]